MHEDTPADHGPSSLATLERIDRICDRFQAAWPGPRPRIEDFLADTTEPERSRLLTRLLAVELEHRCAGGENPTPEDYRARFPDHGEVIRSLFPEAVTLPLPSQRNSPPAAPAVGEVAPPPRFQPLRLHAEGGLGEIHVAQDGELHREVAFKRIKEEYADDNRYNAACAASLAAAGKGKEAAKLDPNERARWRRQAVAWLRADLARWTRQLDTNQSPARAAVRQELRHWQRDPDLAGIRDAGPLAKLPADEQAACKKLWAEVQALLQ
jgi:hypothetical protein